MAKWIWYRGEYETLQYNKIMHRRTNRDRLVTPAWNVDPCFSSVVFRRTFCLKSPQTVKITARGETTVFLDTRHHVANLKNGEITLDKGNHTVWITVYNPYGLPCLYVEGGGIDSDEKWIASNGTAYKTDSDNVAADCREEFCSAEYSPNEFSLPVKKCDYVSKTKINGGVLYDFGKEMLAYTVIQTVGPLDRAQKVSLYYGESRDEALDTEFCESFETLRVKNEARTACTRAYRWLFVVSDKDCEVYADEEYRPLYDGGKFTCNDKKVNAVYDMAYRTLKLNSREMLLDGIKRDRWVWGGDVYASIANIFYSYADPQIIEDSIVGLLGNRKICRHINGIAEYSLYMIISVYEHYVFSGRVEFVKKIYPKVKELAEFCLNACNENGYIASPGVWVFIDWADIDKGYECCAVQIILLQALRCMVKLSSLCGLSGEHYLAEAEKLSDNIYSDFYLGQGKGFAHARDEKGNLCSQNTRYAEIFTLKYNLFDKSVRDDCLKKLLGSNAMPIRTPYMKYHELDALGKAGRADVLAAELKRYWGGLVDCGADCVWEEFNADKKDEAKAMSSHKYGLSLCHIWGAGPVSLLPGYVAGIRFSEREIGKVTVSPRLDIYGSYSAKTVTPDGFVEVKYKNGKLRVCSRNVKGTLVLDGKEYVLDGNAEIIYDKNKKTHVNIREDYIYV